VTLLLKNPTNKFHSPFLNSLTSLVDHLGPVTSLPFIALS
jgi:hypothetical protein